MKIEQLTEGFVFYNADQKYFTWYEYLRPMPVKNKINEGKYHIIINKKREEPERIYFKDLQEILDKNLFTLGDAKQEQIKLTEDWLKYLKNEQESI